MSRKQVVSLTSAILVVALITNITGWIQDAEANPVKVYVQNVTHHCYDSNSGHPWNDICQTVNYTRTLIPYPHEHALLLIFEDKLKFTTVSSCTQCPNPPFTNYN